MNKFAMLLGDPRRPEAPDMHLKLIKPPAPNALQESVEVIQEDAPDLSSSDVVGRRTGPDRIFN